MKLLKQIVVMLIISRLRISIGLPTITQEANTKKIDIAQTHDIQVEEPLIYSIPQRLVTIVPEEMNEYNCLFDFDELSIYLVSNSQICIVKIGSSNKIPSGASPNSSGMYESNDIPTSPSNTVQPGLPENTHHGNIDQAENSKHCHLTSLRTNNTKKNSSKS